LLLLKVAAVGAAAVGAAAVGAPPPPPPPHATRAKELSVIASVFIYFPFLMI
jgi:hypothetical protein